MPASDHNLTRQPDKSNTVADTPGPLFTEAERERLKQTAIVGPRSSVVGSGVVLSPTGNVLCTCHQQSDAELIGKLWNAARGE